MDKELWEKMLEFDFDKPIAEYGFSTRLSNENYWTKAFTQEAILEYKKFMYLAATSDFMVSPSEIVDIVWHQHLIFTQSYQDFCNLMSKQVQHIPSTHNKEDFEKFKQAKERTKKLYINNFGEQPKGIWEYPGMFDSLHLDKAKFKIRTFIIIGILAFIALTVPCYFLLKPVYITINNPYFIFGLIGLTLLIFTGLEILNQNKLKKIADQFDKNSFVYNLQPLELVYLKTQRLPDIINGTANELIDNGTIKVNSDNTIELSKTGIADSIEQLQTANTLHSSGRTFYSTLVKQLAAKPVFSNTANCMDAFKKYFTKSKKFGNLFYLNFGVLLTMIMLGFIRLITGILRDKPVTQIAISIILLVIVTIIYLDRLTRLVCTSTIPNLYRNKILPTMQIQNNWQWNYFLFGSAVLTTSFAPLVNYNNNNNSNSGSSCGTSCGSSCGSSCISCGGCGGD